MKIRLTDESGTIDLKYLIEDVDRHGNVRVYFRRGGTKKRIREPLGSLEFLAAYRNALNGKPQRDTRQVPAEHGTFKWLVEQYFASASFLTLNPTTRRTRRRILEEVCQVGDRGSNRYRLMKPRHVAKIRDEKLDFPEAANARLKVIRALFKWAMLPEVGFADENPAKEVARIKNSSGGHHTWTGEEVQQFWSRHVIGSKARLAIDIILLTGARRADAVKFGSQMVSGGWLNWVETKGKNQIRKERSIPILPALQASINACPSGHLNWLVTSYGKPFTPAGFGNWFRDRCDEAGLQHCSAHGLRKAGATFAANNGATTQQLMAIWGWESIEEAERYTKRADRRRLAGDAIHLIDFGGRK